MVLALHESPRSSLSLIPVIETLAGDYRVIAPDTPGYGLSAPLTGDAPELAQFVEAIAGVLDAFGTDRAIVYGAHTGAALALAFADAYPNRVSALVLDGLAAFNDQEVRDFADLYLAPYAPDWEGRHVMALWSRVKDLFTWFPWYDQTADSRLRHEPLDLVLLEHSALGFLQAGGHYAKGYIRAASYAPNPALRRLTAPATVMARPTDLIAHHLDRLDPDIACDIRWLDAEPGSWASALRDSVARGDRPDPPAAALASLTGSRFVRVGDGWLHIVTAGPPAGPARLLVSGMPGDIFELIDRAGDAHPDERLIALCPPGGGWSDPLIEGGLDAAVEAMAAVVEGLRTPIDGMTAQGASGLLAALLVVRLGLAVRVDLLDPPLWLLDPALAPDGPLLNPLGARWDGAHLTSSWFQLRDLALYDTPPGLGPPRRREPAVLDVARLDAVFRTYVQGPDSAGLLAETVARRIALGGQGLGVPGVDEALHP